MAAKKNQGQNNSSDDVWFVFAIPLVVGILVWFLWEYERSPFILFVYGSDFGQYWVLKHLYDLNIPVTWGPKGEQMLRYVHASLDGRVNPGTVSFEELYNTQTDLGYRIGFTFVIPAFLMTIWIAMKMKGGELRRTFTLSGTGKKEKWFWLQHSAGPLSIIPMFFTTFMDIKFIKLGSFIVKLLGFRKKKIWTNIGLSFMKYQAVEWKPTIFGAEFDPNVENKNMAQSMTPTEWMRENDVPVIDGILDEAKAQKAFERQLGGVWEGYELAPDYIKAILIISWMTLKFFSHSKLVTKVRGDFAVSFTRNEKVNIRKIIKECERKYPNMIKSINAVCSNYHYMNTAVLGYLAWSGPFDYWYGGQGSINAPAMWLWLKQIDRPLWYTLQCCGRRVCFIEGAGAVSHFYFEQGIGQDESSPQMEEAIKGLNKYLDYHHINDLDEFFNKGKLRRDYVGKNDALDIEDSSSDSKLSPLERRKRIRQKEMEMEEKARLEREEAADQAELEKMKKNKEGADDEERMAIIKRRKIVRERKNQASIQNKKNISIENKKKKTVRR